MQAKLINPAEANLQACFQSLPRIPNPFPLERSIRMLSVRFGLPLFFGCSGQGSSERVVPDQSRPLYLSQIIDALDESNDLTEFGAHMCDLPLPPRYSKMVLVSIALKCVDPILTIACILACEDPCTFLSAIPLVGLFLYL